MSMTCTTPHSETSRPGGNTAATGGDGTRACWPVRVYRFYRDGFKSMTVGRTLWAIIGIKLVVFFVILRWIFFPDFLSSKGRNDREKAQYVREQMTGRRQAAATVASPQPQETPKKDRNKQNQLNTEYE